MALQLWTNRLRYAQAGTAWLPSIYLAAPLLPGTPEASEAASLFARRADGDPEVEAAIAAASLVTPYYKHVDGTSFAAPLVSATIACMLQVNPTLSPALIRQILIATARQIPGASVERQGAGALDPNAAVTLAGLERHGRAARILGSPQVAGTTVTSALHERRRRQGRAIRQLESLESARSVGETDRAGTLARRGPGPDPRPLSVQVLA